MLETRAELNEIIKLSKSFSSKKITSIYFIISPKKQT